MSLRGGQVNTAKAKLTDELLRTAAAAYLDHKLVAERRQQWHAIAHEILTTGDAELYAADCLHSTLVDAPSGRLPRARRPRPAAHRRERRRRRRAPGDHVVASPSVTIWEGTYQ